MKAFEASKFCPLYVTTYTRMRFFEFPRRARLCLSKTQLCEHTFRMRFNSLRSSYCFGVMRFRREDQCISSDDFKLSTMEIVSLVFSRLFCLTKK